MNGRLCSCCVTKHLRTIRNKSRRICTKHLFKTDIETASMYLCNLHLKSKTKPTITVGKEMALTATLNRRLLLNEQLQTCNENCKKVKTISKEKEKHTLTWTDRETEENMHWSLFAVMVLQKRMKRKKVFKKVVEGRRGMGSGSLDTNAGSIFIVCQ